MLLYSCDVELQYSEKLLVVLYHVHSVLHSTVFRCVVGDSAVTVRAFPFSGEYTNLLTECFTNVILRVD